MAYRTFSDLFPKLFATLEGLWRHIESSFQSEMSRCAMPARKRLILWQGGGTTQFIALLINSSYQFSVLVFQIQLSCVCRNCLYLASSAIRRPCVCRSIILNVGSLATGGKYREFIAEPGPGGRDRSICLERRSINSPRGWDRFSIFKLSRVKSA